jgi:predicted ABC-type transport system involved in lysophospholipase L1 biosynthesis ATPase subunit
VRGDVRSHVIDGGRPDLVDESITVASEPSGNAIKAQCSQDIATVISVRHCVQGEAVLIDCHDYAAADRCCLTSI